MQFDPNEPDWHLLPHDPRSFFRLEKDFDLKALKRAYNAGIKTFKPDKYPMEFQRIRAAYEDLERLLRYRVQQDDDSTSMSMGIDGLPWRFAPDQATSDHAATAETLESSSETQDLNHTVGEGDSSDLSARNDSPDPPDSSDVIDRSDPSDPSEVEEPSIEQQYQRLEAWTKKEPWHYYHLAILADIRMMQGQAEPHPRSFVDWILEGLKAFPRDGGLSQIWGAYCRQFEGTADELIELAGRVLFELPASRFYLLTEVLWDRIVVEAEWTRVLESLEEMESDLLGNDVGWRIAFYLHFLQRAIWKAPLDWTHAKLQWVNTELTSAHGQQEYDLELLSWLIKYMQNREKILAKGEILQGIDKSLRDMFLLNRREAIRQLFHVQVDLAQRQHEVLAQVRGDYQTFEPLLVPWSWVCETVLQGYGERTVEPESIAAATFQLFRFIENHFPQGDLQGFGTRCQVINLGVWVLCVIPFLAIDLLVGRLFKDNLLLVRSDWLPIILLGMTIATIAAAVWLRRVVQKRWIVSWHNRACRAMIERNYQRWWRRSIARFFSATHFRFHHVDTIAAQILETRSNQLNVTTWFRHFFPLDCGLMIYSLSVRFLR